MTPNLNLWLIPILPLAGAAINGLWGRRSSRQAVTTIALVFSGAAFAMALWVAARFASIPLPYQEFLAHWIRSGTFAVDFSFYLAHVAMQVRCQLLNAHCFIFHG